MSRVYQYTVQGRGAFPLDMLRYDQSFPASEHDAGLIGLSNGERSILLSTTNRETAKGFSRVRWLSFGWIVK